MAINDAGGPALRVMRKRAGAWLKACREHVGLTQDDMGAKLGYTFSTMVSQVERGLSRLPPEDVATWAEAYRIPVDEFAKKLLYYYDPHTFQALYGGPNPLDLEALESPKTRNGKRTEHPEPPAGSRNGRGTSN